MFSQKTVAAISYQSEYSNSMHHSRPIRRKVKKMLPGDHQANDWCTTWGSQIDGNANQERDLNPGLRWLLCDEISSEDYSDPSFWRVVMKTVPKIVKITRWSRRSKVAKNCERITRILWGSGRLDLVWIPAESGWSQVGHSWTAMINSRCFWLTKIWDVWKQIPDLFFTTGEDNFSHHN